MSVTKVNENAATVASATATTVPVASSKQLPVGAMSTTDTTGTTVSMSTGSSRPWYRNGGMAINLIGIVINLIVPIMIMCRVPDDAMKTHEQSMSLVRVLVGAWIFAFITTTRSKTTYCIFVVPTYLVSFMVLPMILQNEPPPAEASSSSSTASLVTWYNVTRILLISAILASWKINICMSVCMHRYASHAAFKCGRFMNIGLCILGCFANQGGPLWWASQHRCHHKLRIILLICIVFTLYPILYKRSNKAWYSSMK